MTDTPAPDAAVQIAAAELNSDQYCWADEVPGDVVTALRKHGWLHDPAEVAELRARVAQFEDAEAAPIETTDARAELIARAAARGHRTEAVDYFAERAAATEADRHVAELEAEIAALRAVADAASDVLAQLDVYKRRETAPRWLRAALDALPARKD